MTPATIAVYCAWCRKVIRPGSTERVSHGCCPDCYQRLLKEIQA